MCQVKKGKKYKEESVAQDNLEQRAGKGGRKPLSSTKGKAGGSEKGAKKTGEKKRTQRGRF